MRARTLNSALAISGPSVFEQLIDGGKALPPLWLGMSDAQALSWLRRRMGVTQVELARLSGVAQSRISRIEAGEDALLSTWVKLYAALGVGLRILPTSRDAGPALQAARKRFRERDFRQVPRLRPCKKPKSGPT